MTIRQKTYILLSSSYYAVDSSIPCDLSCLILGYTYNIIETPGFLKNGAKPIQARIE